MKNPTRKKMAEQKGRGDGKYIRASAAPNPAWLATILSVAMALWLPGEEVAEAQTAPKDAPVRLLSLRECVEQALVNNRSLQIERLNPVIAKLSLDAAYGYYDPAFLAETHRDAVSDSGGFDPADLSKDAIYRAKSCTVDMGLTGFTPSGMSYNLVAEYANSFGTRNNMNFDSFNLYTGITLRQPLLKNFWIDESRLLIKVSKKDLRITELGVAYLSMDIINQVQQAYYELAFAHENLRIRRNLVQVREALLTGIRSQIRHGRLAVQDEKIALAQLATDKAGLIGAEKDLALAENTLRTLMGDPFLNTFGTKWVPGENLVAVPRVFDFQDCAQRGLAQRPDVMQLRQDVEKAELNLKYRRNQLFPSLDLVAGYGRRGASTRQVPTFWPIQAKASFSEAMTQVSGADNPNDMIGIIFSVPLNRTAERANYRASKELKAQAVLLVKQCEELVLREISDALRTAKVEWERVAATRQATAFAQEAIAVEERKLAGGKSTIYLVLELQADLAEAQEEEMRALADYNQAVAQLDFAQGILLEKWGIKFEFK